MPSLLFNPKDGILRGLRDPEFNDGLGRDLDLLLRLGIDAGSRFPLLLHELAKARQDEFAVLLDLPVGEARESVEECSGGSFVSVCRGSEGGLKFGLGHFLQALFYTRQSRRFQGIRSLKPRGIAAATLTLLKRIYGSPEEPSKPTEFFSSN